MRASRIHDDDDWYAGGWFGPSWGAPVCEEKDQRLDTPVGALCIDCLLPIAEDDNGLAVPFVYEIGSMSLTYHHRACFLRGLEPLREYVRTISDGTGRP